MSRSEVKLKSCIHTCLRGPRSILRMRKLLAACLAVVLVLSPCGSGSISAGGSEQIIINRWCLEAMNVPREPAGGEQVRIALIDSGCADDGGWLAKGQIAPGQNYVFGTTNTLDLIGHGTQVTSILLGANSAGRELVGFSQTATLVPLVWISKYASGVLANGGVEALAAAVRDAVDLHRCRVVNVSSGLTRDEPLLRDAIAYAEEKGAVVIAAVGNSNLYAASAVYYPAAYESVLGVGSVDGDLQVSSWSQRNQSVLLTAPGEGVYALTKAKLKSVSGTSFAAAHATAAVARLLSDYPELSPQEVRSLLERSARDLGDAGYDTSYGHGLIDLGHCLELAAELTGTR